MNQPVPIKNPIQFMLAGKATFTIRNRHSGVRFTFKVRQPKPTTPWFVSVMTGTDNEKSYSYLGTIFKQPDTSYVYAHGRKSRITSDSPSAIVFNWFFKHLMNQTLPEAVEIHHCGKCGRCGRTLTVPESIESGFGPECIQFIS